MKFKLKVYIRLILMLMMMAMPIISCNQKEIQKAEQLIPFKAQSFGIGEVRLLAGPFKDSQDAEAKYLLSLDIDRMLAPFLTESGLQPKSQAYPGWETESLPGVALSFYLSGTSRLYAATGDEVYLKNINYILGELKKCQAKNNGYLLGTKGGKQLFKKLEEQGFYEDFNGWGNGHGEPYYVMEKLFSGLIDVYRICKIPLALQTATNLADWLDRHMSQINDTELQKIMNIEFGGMNWVLSDLYAITGEKKYLAMSERWQDNTVTVPLTKGIDVLPGIHANTQFPKMSGLAARYPYTGDPSDLKGATFFWENVVNHHTYATGGNSESEYFHANDSLSKSLTPYTEENCNEYNMLKLTSLLFRIEPRAEYADYIERTLFNHTLSAQNPADGRVCYHLALMPGAERKYYTLYDDFSCCVCSGMDSYTRHSEYIYAHTESDIIVNLFIASEINWKEKGIILKQETNFPWEDITRLKIECNKDTEIGLRIRCPEWLSEPAVIKINGQTETIAAEGGYFTINRTWHSGDITEIKLPMNIRTEAINDDQNLVSLFYGPVLLAAALEKDEANSLLEDNAAPALITADKPVGQWVKPMELPLSFVTTVASPKQIILKPFFTIKTGPYSVYFRKTTTDEWNKRLALRESKKQELIKLDRVTIDKVIAGDAGSESSHGLAGESSTGKGNNGIFNDLTWRTIYQKGNFSYELKVDSKKPVALQCKFMGRDQYERWDCSINVDTTSIVQLKRPKDDSYPVVPFEAVYPIPLELTKGRNVIKVVFEVNGVAKMPRLMEMRTIIRQ